MGSSTIILYIIIAVIAVSVFMQYENFTNEMAISKSSVDGKSYLVRNLSDKEAASNLLATIRGRCIILVNYLADNFPKDEAVIRLKTKFIPDNISEGTKDSTYTRYSVNKGEKIVFCLRSRDKNEDLVDDNVMMFVALHELAHVMSKSVGHTEEFWDNFRFLLKQGIQAGVYEKQDFRKKSVNYCGVAITDTPLND